MNWREFTALTEAMADGRAETNAQAINRALDKRALTRAAACWLRFASACGGRVGTSARELRPPPPSSWLPPTP